MNQSSPKASILIISYNQEDYIAEAIESAVSQDYENLEVVVSDDGSTDRTPQIIDGFKKRFPDRLVSVSSKNNVGITRNSNRGLEACTGEFICFQGGDDVLLPGKVRAQVNWFQVDSKRVLCGHPVELFYEDGSARARVTNTLPDGEGPVTLIKEGVPYAATSIMVRSAAIPKGGFEESIPTASDYLFWMEVVANGGCYGAVPAVYARHRRHSANVTNKPLAYFDDLARTYAVFSERHSSYRQQCEKALTRNYYYYFGVLKQRAGQINDARSLFKTALRREPSFLKGWIRLLSTYAPGA